MAEPLLRSLSSLCVPRSCPPLSKILFLLPTQLQQLQFSNAAAAAAIPSKNPNNNDNDKDNDKMMNLLASNATTPKRIFKAFNKNPAFLNNTAALKMAVRKLARQGATHEIELIIEKLLLKSSRRGKTKTKTKTIHHSKQIHRDEEQQQQHEQMQEQVAMQALNMYAEAGMADHMVRTFEKHLRTTAKASSLPLFNAFIRGLVAAGNPKMALNFFHNHNLPYGVCPNLITYNIAVKALCDDMQHESAIELLLCMKQRSRIEASHVSYDTIVDSLNNQLKNNQISKAQMEDLMEKLLKSCESEEVEFGIRFRRLCKERKTAEAKLLMQQMICKGFYLQLHEITTLVIALCKQGLLEDAKNVFFGIIDNQPHLVAVSMSSEVMNSESQSYNVIARCFLRKGDAEAAMAVCRRMAHRQYAFEESTVRALLSCEATASQAQSMGLTANSNTNNPSHEQRSKAEPSVLLF